MNSHNETPAHIREFFKQQVEINSYEGGSHRI